MSAYLNTAALKRLAREHGKRLSRAALEVFERHLVARILSACALHDGGRVTVSADAAAIAVRNGKIEGIR